MFTSIFIQVSAQRRMDLITYTHRENIGFSTIQIEKLNKIISNPLYIAHYYVQITELPSFSIDGTITLNVPRNTVTILNFNSNDFDGDGIPNTDDDDPFDPCVPSQNNPNCCTLIPVEQDTFTFTPINIETEADSVYTYYGEYDQCGDENGYITIIAKDGNLFGQININDDVYELIDLGERKNILVKWDLTSFPSIQCAVTSNESLNVPVTEQISNRNSACDVSVLVLYTSRAAAIANPRDKAVLAIKQTNEIARNSSVPISFSLAGVAELTGFIENQDSDDTRDRLKLNQLANQLRDLYHADMVSLFTDGNFIYEDNLGYIYQVTGNSYLDRWGQNDWAYNVIEIDAALGRYTFTHELTHHFGCKHDNDDRGLPDYVFSARAYRFLTGWWPFRKERKTLLCNLYEGESNIMHWSNPSIKFKKEKTGVVNERNNAAQVTTMGCTVSDFRSFTTTSMTVSISGPDESAAGQIVIYNVDVANCTNILNIYWEYSFDGFHFKPAQGSLSCSLTMPSKGSLYVRVTVICQEGNQKETAFIMTLNANDPDSNPRIRCDQQYLISGTENIGFENLSIYPIPAGELLNIKFNLHMTSKLNINIIDITGKLIDEIINTPLNSGKHEIKYDISELNSGIYILNFVEDGNIINKRLIKI